MTGFPQTHLSTLRQRRFLVAVALVLGAVLLPAALLVARQLGGPVCSDVPLARCLGDWIASTGFAGYAVSSALMVLCSVTMLPAEFVAAANGLVYGAWVGGVLSWGSALAGANLGYALGRFYGPDAIAHVGGDVRLGHLEAWAGRHGGLALFAVRLMPLVPFFAVNFAAGALRINWVKYNIATGLGIVPTLAVFSLVGDAVWRMPWTVWVSLAVGLFLLAVIVHRTVRKT